MEPPEERDVRADRGEVLRWTLLFFFPLFTLLLTLAWFVRDNHVRPAETLLRQRERDAVELQQKTLVEDIDRVVSDVNFLRDALHVVGEGVWGPPPEAETVRKNLGALLSNFSNTMGMYDQIRLLDENGIERIRVNFNDGDPILVPDEDLQNKKNRYYFADTMALDEGDVFVSPLDLNIEQGQIERPLKPMIRIGTPVFDARGTKRGIVLVNYLGSIMLERFRALGKTSPGDSLLLNRDGYYLVGPGEDDAWGFMYPGREHSTFERDFRDAWERVRAAEAGQFETANGLCTFTTVHPLPEGLRSSTGAPGAEGKSRQRLTAGEYYWKVVSHLSAPVYHAEATRIRHVLVPTVSILALLLAFASYRQAYSRAFRRATLQHREALIAELRRALAEVKTLQGILPICMHCKKIRNDDEAWDRIEKYIGERTGVEFSHGICPDCIEKYYSEYDLPDS